MVADESRRNTCLNENSIPHDRIASLCYRTLPQETNHCPFRKAKVGGSIPSIGTMFPSRGSAQQRFPNGEHHDAWELNKVHHEVSRPRGGEAKPEPILLHRHQRSYRAIMRDLLIRCSMKTLFCECVAVAAKILAFQKPVCKSARALTIQTIPLVS